MTSMTELPVYSSVRIVQPLEGDRAWPPGTVGVVVESYGAAGAAVEIIDREGYTVDLVEAPWSALDGVEGETAVAGRPTAR
jgi:hypothetical protein